MDVLQLTRDRRRSGPPCTSAMAASMAMQPELDFGAVASRITASGQRQPRLRQAELQGAVHAGLDDGDRLRIGKANILRRGAAGSSGRPTAGRPPRESAPDSVPPRPDRSRGWTSCSADRSVIMIVAVLVIAHGRALRQPASRPPASGRTTPFSGTASRHRAARRRSAPCGYRRRRPARYGASTPVLAVHGMVTLSRCSEIIERPAQTARCAPSCSTRA